MFGVDPTFQLIRLRERDYTITARPEASELEGKWWWLMWDDMCFRIAERQPGDRNAAAVAEAWLTRNVLDPKTEPGAAEKGPAWTALEDNPLIVENHGRTHRVWAKMTGGVSFAGPAREGRVHWFVDGAMGPEVSCDDTIAEVAAAIRSVVRK